MTHSHDTHCLDICRCPQSSARGRYVYDAAQDRCVAVARPQSPQAPDAVTAPTLHTGQYL